MTDFFKILNQFKDMQGRLQQAQEGLAKQSFMAAAGGGMVSATCDGKMQLTKIKIDKSIVSADDLEMLEDLIVVAVGEAQKKAAEAMQMEMSKVTGGIDLPFKLPF